jgi:hypothetical protein
MAIRLRPNPPVQASISRTPSAWKKKTADTTIATAALIGHSN